MHPLTVLVAALEAHYPLRGAWQSWADRAIARSADAPPAWLIDLAFAESPTAAQLAAHRGLRELPATALRPGDDARAALGINYLLARDGRRSVEAFLEVANRRAWTGYFHDTGLSQAVTQLESQLAAEGFTWTATSREAAACIFERWAAEAADELNGLLTVVPSLAPRGAGPDSSEAS